MRSGTQGSLNRDSRFARCPRCSGDSRVGSVLARPRRGYSPGRPSAKSCDSEIAECSNSRENHGAAEHVRACQHRRIVRRLASLQRREDDPRGLR